jgi:hypothetical protein
VINGSLTASEAIWIHNDNGRFTLKATSAGNRDLPESTSNLTASPGFSFGGTNQNFGEFGILTGSLTIGNIQNIPRSLKTLPALMGGDFVYSFTFHFLVDPLDIFWSDMELYLNVSEVLVPGQLWISKEMGGGGPINYQITNPGPVIIPLGNFTGYPFNMINLTTPSTTKGRALFGIDCWGLRSRYSPPPPDTSSL